MNIKNDPSLKKLLSKPVFNTSEARALGIHPSRLSYYVKLNLIKRIARGVYKSANSKDEIDFKWEEVILGVKSVPKGIICLTSALIIYDLTDEFPRSLWIAIPHASTAPRKKNMRFIRMRDMKTGKTKIKLHNIYIPIFDMERTIIDAFRYLSKEIAIKALKKAVVKKGRKKLALNKLQRYAKKFKINLDPYILMATT